MGCLAMPKRVVVIGAGVLGAASAWRLAEAGHVVTVLDPAPGAQASAGSLAWLNASFAEDPVYNRLRHESLKLWEALKAAHEDLPVIFPGAILWAQDHFDLPAIEAAQADLGRPAKMLDREAHLSREPAVPVPPEESLALEADGYGLPAEITAWFLDRARAAGAEVLAREATGLEVVDGRVKGVHAAGTLITCSQVVIAAGVKLPELMGPHGAGIAMDNKPGLLVTTSPAPAAISAMLATDGLHGWQGADGRFLIGADFGGGESFEDPEVFAQSLVDRLASRIPGTEGCKVERITVRERPMPADGRPAIGPLGPSGAYIVCTHSGMTLAPVIAEMVAREIGGEEEPRLAPYRPERPALQGGA